MPQQLVYVAMPGSDGAKRHDVGVSVFRRKGDSDRVLVNIEIHEESCGILGHG